MTMLSACLGLMLLAGAADPSWIPTPGGAERDDRMEWWREARFGMFLHWGLYAIPAGEWNGGTGHAEWIRTTAQIPLAEYDNFVQEFNPVNFNADEWAAIARNAGMRYIVITTKHHDGFCLFDSAETDFDIMATPFQRDIMKELADATRAQGLRMGWYHSIMDWHHPDYLHRRDWETTRSTDGADFDRFVEYLQVQVEELLTNYGPIDIMWFDGEWEDTWTHEHGIELYDHVREISPDTIINNRVDKGRAGIAGLTVDDSFRGDFGTPEQEIPPTGLPGVDWETCMTMNDHWGYNALDDNWKSTTTLIRTLVDVSSKGGNFLLNVGPKADGTFPEEAITRLRDIGAWMDVNGESIYGTSASPFGPLPWGRCTMKQMSPPPSLREGAGGRVEATDSESESTHPLTPSLAGRGIDPSTTRLYLHIFEWPQDRRLRLPGLANNVRDVTVLGTGDQLSGVRDATDIVIELPQSAPDPHCSVIAVEVTGELEIYRPPAISTPATEFVDLAEISIEAGDPRIDEIRFTIDGTDPSGAAAIPYKGPFRIGAATAVIRARGFVNGVAKTPVAAIHVRKVEPRPAEAVNAADLTPGLLTQTWRGDWNQLPDFSSLGNAEIGVTREIAPIRAERVAMRFTGYIVVPADEVYVFSLTSDDGARIFIGDTLVIDNDGLHVATEKQGTIALAAGLHPITLDWFNRTGDAALELKMGRTGQPVQSFPADSLFHSSD
jgi:alpha-L-fucosidase